MNANCASPFNLDATTSACSNVTCTGSFTPKVTLQNGGQNALTSCTFSYKVGNGSPQTYNWTGSLASNQNTIVTLPAITVSTAGTHTLSVTTSAPNGGTDQNTGNDTKTYTFTADLNPGSSLPVTETFAGTFPGTGWSVINPDNDKTWAKNTSVGGFGTSTSCMYYDAYNYNASGESDELMLPSVNLAGLNNPKLEFDLAHAPYNTTYVEKLEVLVSTDCAGTWTSVYNKSGATLGTAVASTNQFTPTASQWRKETISMSSYTGQAKAFIKLKVTNGYGNNVFVDNINVTESVGINEGNIIGNTLHMFPNPAHDQLNITFDVDKAQHTTVNLYNSLGEIVGTHALNAISTGTQNLRIDTGNYPAGLYIVEHYCPVKNR